MNKNYDVQEPMVIDEEMLQDAVFEQGPKGEAGKLAKKEGIEFEEVNSLRLDFKNILKIDNLWSFKNLTKLQLDNNIIERIKGLDSLVHLVWLDLSFNNIEVIEGLDNLKQIEDLTLYHNQIKKIENMQYLKKLHVFSIGKNNISDLETIKYLRQFENLKTVNLSGNKICDDLNYESFVISHLKRIRYLDYRLVDERAREVACVKYESMILEIEDKEKTILKELEKEEKKKKEMDYHKAAYVEFLNDSTLFDTLFTHDEDGKSLAKIPTVDELVMNYREQFCATCMEIFKFGLKTHEERKIELEMFWECVNDAKKQNTNYGRKLVDDFLAYRENVLIALRNRDNTITATSTNNTTTTNTSTNINKNTTTTNNTNNVNTTAATATFTNNNTRRENAGDSLEKDGQGSGGVSNTNDYISVGDVNVTQPSSANNDINSVTNNTTAAHGHVANIPQTTTIQFHESLSTAAAQGNVTKNQQDIISKTVTEYMDKIQDLWTKLMSNELLLVEQLEEVVKEFERSLSDMVSTFKENVNGLFSHLRDWENQHNEKIIEIGQMTLEKMTKYDFDEEVPDDIRSLFVDKDTLNNIITTSHDLHLMKIDNREDEMMGRIHTWFKDLTDGIHEREEIERNRKRVVEINHLVSYFRKDVEHLL